MAGFHQISKGVSESRYVPRRKEGRKQATKVSRCGISDNFVWIWFSQAKPRLVKHSQTFCSVPIWKACFTYEYQRGGILHSYTYSLRVGGKLYQIVTQVCIRSLPFMQTRGKKPPLPMPHDLCLFRFMIVFVSCFMVSIAQGEVRRGTFTKWGVQTWLLSVS